MDVVHLIVAKEEIQSMKNTTLRDLSVRRRKKEPSSQVEARDVASDSVPYLKRSALKCRLVHEVNLGKVSKKLVFGKCKSSNAPALSL